MMGWDGHESGDVGERNRGGGWECVSSVGIHSTTYVMPLSSCHKRRRRRPHVATVVVVLLPELVGIGSVD